MLVLSIDPRPSESRSIGDIVELVRKVDGLLYGYKIGVPFLLKYGLEGLAKLRSSTSKPIIADLKLADIGDIMSITAEFLASVGANAVIAHSFVGKRGALDVLRDKLRELGMDLILVASMTHQGSAEYIDNYIEDFVKLALELGAEGVVAPATRPSIIKSVRDIAGNGLAIYSPGIGAQGAAPGTAICHGANYEIVGRSVLYSDNPVRSLLNIAAAQREVISRCRSS